MPARSLLALLVLLLMTLGCDLPGVGWSGTEAIDEDVERIQEASRERIAAGEMAPSGPAAEALEVAAATDEPGEAAEEVEAEPFVPDAGRGATVYSQFCASCHGSEGKGDGVAGTALDPRPTDHTDAVYMNGLSNDHLYKVVFEGGAAVGKSADMAPWGAAIGDEGVWDVVAYMRELSGYEGSIP